MKTVRCAIYTRKSSDEGLEQSFNSLDAQREACAAYILSQASEGWTEVAGHYDDGGLSGGTLERPALQRLLTEVAAGAIDIIVVYKVDRLTRSLLDFSKLVEAFDASGTSFVSVTQSFNTTTSMGRLTLNMLLSFAQFEREVTAERIRDKIAASKAKGMWMGGIPPLGYCPNERSLTIVEPHANVVRHVFARYLALGNVRLLEEELRLRGHHSPKRTTATGKAFGGVPFSRGQLYLMLKCQTYRGEIAHKGVVYPGLHDAIIGAELWEQVQATLAANLNGKRSGTYARNPSLLAGIVTDSDAKPLVATHASKGKARYRYYTGEPSADGPPMRMPAREIETMVCEHVAALCDDPLDLIATAWVDVPADRYCEVVDRIGDVAARLRRRERDLVRGVITGVQIHRDRIVIDCSPLAIATALGATTAAAAPEVLTLTHEVRLKRSGKAMRLVHDSGARVGAAPDRSLIRLIVQSHGYWRELRKGDLDIKTLAVREGVSASWITRTLRLAFLAPNITAAILKGTQRGDLDSGRLVGTDAVAAHWSEQRQTFLPASG